MLYTLYVIRYTIYYILYTVYYILYTINYILFYDTFEHSAYRKQVIHVSNTAWNCVCKPYQFSCSILGTQLTGYFTILLCPTRVFTHRDHCKNAGRSDGSLKNP